jgi:hypothetical protein
MSNCECFLPELATTVRSFIYQKLDNIKLVGHLQATAVQDY